MCISHENSKTLDEKQKERISQAYHEAELALLKNIYFQHNVLYKQNVMLKRYLKDAKRV